MTSKMKPSDEKKDTVTFRAVSHDEEGRKKVEKLEVNTHNTDTIKYIEKKLKDKGVMRMERRPAHGLGIGRPTPKGGHGGKYTWEGPSEMAETELSPSEAALDEKDPNYVDEEAEGRIVRGEDDVLKGYVVVGEVEVLKTEEVGVARFDVDPKLNAM